MTRKSPGIAVLLLTLVGCSPPPPPPSEPATALYFVESDGPEASNPVRMIVTRKFLRIDAGRSTGDFLLYDRAARTTYNVSVADRLVLVIASRPVPAGDPAPKLHYRTKRDTATFPAVGGKLVTRYRLLTNGRLCYDLYAADGLLPDAVVALREYREALAGEHAAAIGFTPNEMKQPCDLANHVYAPARHLVHGFPVRLVELDSRDPKRRRVTELIDYRTDFAAAPDLFDIPASFRRMPIRELRTRRVR